MWRGMRVHTSDTARSDQTQPRLTTRRNMTSHSRKEFYGHATCRPSHCRRYRRKAYSGGEGKETEVSTRAHNYTHTRAQAGRRARMDAHLHSPHAACAKCACALLSLPAACCFLLHSRLFLCALLARQMAVPPSD